MYDNHNEKSLANLLTVNSPLALTQAVKKHLGILIHVHSSHLKEKANDKELNLNNDGHILTAVNLNPDQKTFNISNEWGLKADRNFTIEELYEAIKGAK